MIRVNFKELRGLYYLTRRSKNLCLKIWVENPVDKYGNADLSIREAVFKDFIYGYDDNNEFCVYYQEKGTSLISLWVKPDEGIPLHESFLVMAAKNYYINLEQK